MHPWYLFLIVSIILYVALARFQPITLGIHWLMPFNPSNAEKVKNVIGKQVLLVIAHPDDEAMFFSPTLDAFRKFGINVHLLCLSTGNADGMGNVRKGELERSAMSLGIKSFKIVDDELLQDGMQKEWKKEAILNHVQGELERLKIKTIVTFDNQGISGHANHISIHNAVKDLPIQTFCLSTVSIVRKYLSFLDISLSLAEYAWNPNDILLISSPFPARIAMEQHESQMVWFRRYGWCIFGRYMVINQLRELT